MTPIEARKALIPICRRIMELPPKGYIPYAKAYAERALQMLASPEPVSDRMIFNQVLYIQNNLSAWRGEEAQKARKVLYEIRKVLG